MGDPGFEGATAEGFRITKDDSLIISNEGDNANYIIKKVELTLFRFSDGVYKGITHIDETSVNPGSVTTSASDGKVTIDGINSASVKITNNNDVGGGITVNKIKIYYAELTDLETASNVTAADSTYTGSVLTPVIKVGNTTLIKGTDYTYKVYKTRTPSETEEPITNPTDSGTYYVKIAAVDGSAYTGETTVAWTVNKADLTNDNVAAGIKFPRGSKVTIGTRTYDDTNAVYGDYGVTFFYQTHNDMNKYYIYGGGEINGKLGELYRELVENGAPADGSSCLHKISKLNNLDHFDNFAFKIPETDSDQKEADSDYKDWKQKFDESADKVFIDVLNSLVNEAERTLKIREILSQLETQPAGSE